MPPKAKKQKDTNGNSIQAPDNATCPSPMCRHECRSLTSTSTQGVKKVLDVASVFNIRRPEEIPNNNYRPG